MLYVRKQTIVTIPKCRRWHRFATKLQLAARLVEWIAPILKKAGKIVWVVVDGGYTKAPFLKRVLKIAGVVVVGRLRKDAALRDLPPKLRKGQRRGRGRPRPAFTVKWAARTASAWPNEPGRLAAGSRSTALSMAKQRRRLTRPFWQRTLRQAA